MSGIWLPAAKAIDLSAGHGYGPFREPFLGVIAHVNQSNGNLANFFRNSTDVCPNFQVYKDGSIEQYLPLNWQPWCQTAGNQQYAAIESEGYNTEQWTDAQVAAIGYILGAYQTDMGLALQLADAPGQAGFGWHGMGGVAWGNHPACPGDPRKSQRQDALAIAGGDMALTDDDIGRIWQYGITKPGTVGGPGNTQAAFWVMNHLWGGIDGVAASVAAPIDVNALAAAIVAKLPPTALTPSDVQDACTAALGAMAVTVGVSTNFAPKESTS